MNSSKKPVSIFTGEGILSSYFENQDSVEYHISVNDISIQMMVERILVDYATTVEELKKRISELEARIERSESRNRQTTEA